MFARDSIPGSVVLRLLVLGYPYHCFGKYGTRTAEALRKIQTKQLNGRLKQKNQS